MYEPKNIPIRNNSRRKVEIDRQGFDEFGGVREGRRRISVRKILLGILVILLLVGAVGAGAFYYKTAVAE